MSAINRRNVLVSGSFDDIRARHIRFLEQAAQYGPLTVRMWTDETIFELTKKPPKFTEEERLYFVQAVRYVDEVKLTTDFITGERVPTNDLDEAAYWVTLPEDHTQQMKAFCAANDLKYIVLKDADLVSYSQRTKVNVNGLSNSKKVVVTGCFDWLHSGHIRFFEESSAFGDLTVVLGNDANVQFLKGQGHPLFSEEERRFMVQSIRYVHQALVASGSGWLDAEPEIRSLRPDMYVVNEDGDKPEKRSFCQENGIEYIVLKRLPKEGLPKRESTALRGF